MKTKAINVVSMLLGASLLWSMFVGQASGQPVTIIRVIDGDTYQTEDGRRIRLAGVDAPELKQLGGYDAKHLAERMVLGKEVNLVGEKPAAWGRVEASIRWSGFDLGATLLQRGYGYVDERYVRDSLRAQYLELQQKAKEERKGVWQRVVPPWEFRNGPSSPPPVKHSNNSSGNRVVVDCFT